MGKKKKNTANSKAQPHLFLLTDPTSDIVVGHKVMSNERANEENEELAQSAQFIRWTKNIHLESIS